MPRKLGEEEARVWKKVARTVSPLRRPHGKQAAKPFPPIGPSRQDFANMLRVPPTLPSKPRANPAPLRVSLDKKTRRGMVEINAKTDLHDMTYEQARQSLQKAVIRASNRNHGCLLVITGKGAQLGGVLRRSLTGWLEEPAIRPLIASYAPSHRRHGGSGAWYVFLKT
jgi:DNA-nicking Smr family endonuclease